jgi:4-amino-4-deoxy-L-arabinose transferase-like glycosyltransferase
MIRPLEWIALATILILAAALRLGAPGVVEFKRDEANLSHLALDLARGREFPLLGIDSSVGIRNAPVNVYLITLPYLLTSDPIVATQFVGLLNVIAVGLTYWLARRYYGPVAAVVAGLLYAVSPWAVIFSRKIWAQDMLPVFVLLTVGSGLLGFVEGKRWAQLAHLPLLAITGQIHYGAFVLIPVTVYLMVTSRRRLTRAFLVSVAIAVIILIPYVVGLAQSGLLNVETLRRITAPRGQPNPITISGVAFEYAALTIAGTEIHSLAGPQAFQSYLASVPNAYPLFNMLILALIGGAAWLAVRVWRCRDRRAVIDLALLIWLLFTPLVFSVTWTPMYTHYLIPMIPAAYLIIGVGAHDLWQAVMASHTPQWIGRLALVAGGIALVAVVVFQVWLQVALLNFLNDHNTPGGFGTPLGYLMPIRDAIIAQRPQNIVANLDGQFTGFHEETTIWNFLLYDVPSVRFVDGDTEVYPSQPALYFSHQCVDASQQVKQFNLRPSEGCLAISTRAPGDLDLSRFSPVKDDKRFANGVRVVGYRWEPDPDGCLFLAWTVEGPRPEDFSFAIHFFNDKKEKMMDADGLSWRGRYWRAGDTIVRRFCLRYGQEHKAEIAGVRVGMYTYEDAPEGRKFYGVDLLDANGAAGEQMLEIPLGK